VTFGVAGSSGKKGCVMSAMLVTTIPCRTLGGP
jgi:hypothetical protein